MQEFGPLILALATLLGGGATYWWQKRQDRREELVRLRQELYRAYLSEIQKILSASIRTQHPQRREAIDAFRSIEASLYVTAPRTVAELLPELHKAFVEYTRCIRTRYEPGYGERYAAPTPSEMLEEYEAGFLHKYRGIVTAMRADTLKDSRPLTVSISLASRENPRIE